MKKNWSPQNGRRSLKIIYLYLVSIIIRPITQCNLKSDRIISVCFQGKPFNITVIQVYTLTSNAEEAEAEVKQFYEDLWRRQWHPTPVLLPGKSHRRRSLVGCSPWGCWGSDMTEQLDFHFSLSCIEEGGGDPLQCSCLENPRDGGAWWAAVYGITQSQTRLKWLSSSMKTYKTF